MSAAVARRYALALFSLADDEGALEQTGVELRQLAEVVRDPELTAALSNPLLSAQARHRVAETLAERLALRRTTRNFLHLLADKQRLTHLVAITDRYRDLLDAARGRVRAELSSAVPLSEEQKGVVLKCIEKVSGKTVLATSNVNPKLLGGVIVDVRGKIYDGSLDTQLRRLATRIATGGSSLSTRPAE